MSDRFVGPEADEIERAAEGALRPRHLEDFVGQDVVRGQLSVVLRAATSRALALTMCCYLARLGWVKPLWP